MKIRFGHLYAADMNPRVRSKPGKIRPVVMVQSSAVIDAGSPGVVIVPTTTKLDEQNALRIRLPAAAAGNRFESDVLVDQVHTLDRALFRREIGQLPLETMSRILDGLSLLIPRRIE
jgi:mRNA interferase MazF